MTKYKLSEQTKIEKFLRVTGLSPTTSIVKSMVLKLYEHTKQTKSGLNKICLEGMGNKKGGVEDH